MNRLKQLRDAAGMKQREVAAELGVARTAVAKYERGELDLNTGTIRLLCSLFQVSADYLLGFASDYHIAMVRAYQAAPENIQTSIDILLRPYLHGCTIEDLHLKEDCI